MSPAKVRWDKTYSDEFLMAFGYADDLVLIAPSLAGLKCMIKICEDYAEQYNFRYNGGIWMAGKMSPNIKF